MHLRRELFPFMALPRHAWPGSGAARLGPPRHNPTWRLPAPLYFSHTEG